MSSAAEKTLTIYLHGGDMIRTVGRVNKRKAMYMSPEIRDQVYAGGCKEMRDSQAAIFHAPLLDIPSAQVIMRWIDGYNTYGERKGQEITLEHVGSDEFTAVVGTYSAARVMGIGKNIRGDIIRDDIIHYIHMAPLTANELIMIHECTAFDPTLLSSAIHCTINFDMGRNKAPEMRQIEQYFQSVGMGKALVDVRAHIVRERKAKREAKAAEQGN